MKKNKAIIFDSGTLISFTSAGLLDELEKLGENFDGFFVMTKEVKKEVIDKPLNIKRFALSALKISHLLDKKIIIYPSDIGISDQEISDETNKVLDIANNIVFEKSRPIKIIDSGEASCLALSKLLIEKKMENIIAVDERTTRMLGENPNGLGKLMQRKLHIKLRVEGSNFNYFKNFKFIRSAELIYVAYKKGLIDLKGESVLESLLFAVKYSGAAISGDEIREIIRIK